MDEEDGTAFKDTINQEYMKTMVDKYLNNFADIKQGTSKRLGFHSMNLVSPLLLQHQFIAEYLHSKDTLANVPISAKEG